MPSFSTTKARFVDRAPADESWRGLHRVADSHIKNFAGPFVASVEALRRRVSLDALEDSAVKGTLSREVADAIDGIRVAKAANPEDLAQPVYAELLHAGAEVAANQMGITLRFDVTSPQVLKAAQTMTADLIRGVSQETKSGVRRLIFEGIRDGIPPRDTAKLLRQTLGLTTRQSMAVSNLRKGLLSGGADLSFADKQAARFSDRLLRDRAENVARTETMRAANRGQQLLWSDMRDQGVIGEEFGQRWLVTPDDRLCSRCAPMSGKVVQLGNLFRETERGVLPSKRVPFAGATTEGPPLHPRCRCTLVFDDDLERLPEPAPVPELQPEVPVKPVVPKPAPSTVTTPRPAAPSLPPVDVPDGVYDALMPKRGGWTTQSRKKTLDDLKATWGKDGKILGDTLSGFQRNGSIPRLRTQIANHMSGKESNDRARVVIDALRGANPARTPATLHRGMVVKGSPNEVLEKFFRPGHKFDHNISSYSIDSKLAQSFADPKASTVKVDGARVVIKLEGDVKALPIENLAPTNVFAGEKEWVTAGRFEVVSSKVVKKKLQKWDGKKWVPTGETADFVEATIRQVAL